MNEKGFTLLELVVAVGILLVMTTGGILAYGGIQNNARQAFVEKTAKEVLTAAVAYEVDSESSTNYKKAETEWNDSKRDESVNVVVQKLEDGCLIVDATFEDRNESSRAYGDGCVEDEDSNNGGSETTPPVEETQPPIVDNNYEILVETDYQFFDMSSDMRVAGSTQKYDWQLRFTDNAGYLNTTKSGSFTSEYNDGPMDSEYGEVYYSNMMTDDMTDYLKVSNVKEADIEGYEIYVDAEINGQSMERLTCSVSKNGSINSDSKDIDIVCQKVLEIDLGYFGYRWSN